MKRREMTPELLIELGSKRHGKTWKTDVAIAIGVDRTAVHKWSVRVHKMSQPIQMALKRHFRVS